MKRLQILLSSFVLVLGATLAGSFSSVTVGRTPLSSEAFLPEPSDLPGKWTVTDEGERTKVEVAEAIGSEGELLLTAWRWRENYYRELTRIDPSSFPDGTTYINVSVHRFANAEGTAEALDYFADIVVAAEGLEEVEPSEVADRSRGLAGRSDNVNLYVFLVQSGQYLVRFAGASALGNPAPTIDALAARILSQTQGGTPSAPGPALPASIANGCWSSADQVISASGEMSFLAGPEFILDPSLEYYADIHTSLGAFEVELNARQSPDLVNNFVCLANAGFYNGTLFFRTMPGLLIQGGDPTGTGTGGPGYTFGDEMSINNYAAGAIAYANSSPTQNGSQFFVAVIDLNGSIASDFPVFGRVVDGMDVVEEIANTDVHATYASPLPAQADVVILESVEIIAHPPVSGPFITPSPAATPTFEAAGALELDATDIAFVPNELTITAADEPVTITMKNTGAAPHNFSIDSLDIDVDVDPGETVDIVIPAGTAPGTYDFYCNVPGHKEAGMVGKLTVN